MTIVRFGFAAMAASMACMALPEAKAETRVGVAGAVNPSAAGTAPGAAARQLTVGSDIVFRERVVTTTDGQAQILFLDQSSLLIGPNSTVVIDEFVYDPATNKGNIAATLTQGSFRYIGGKLSKQGAATLKTPVATLGIRGSDVTVAYNAANALMNIVTTHGSATVTTATEIVALRSGFGLAVSGSGGPQGGPTALTAQQIAAANGAFEGQPGKSGGAGKPPTDGDVANSGIGAAVEAQGVAGIEPAAGGAAAGAGFANVPFTPSNNDTPPTVQQQQQQQPQPPVPPTPDPPTGPKTSRVLNGHLSGLAFNPASPGARFAVTDDGSSAAPTGVQIETDSSGAGRVFATFKYRGVSTQSLASAVISYGDPSNASVTQSIFLDDSAFIATQASPASAGLGALNGVNAAANGVMISVSAAPLCACDYVNWGTWQANVQTSNNANQVSGYWVAGQLPNISDPSPQGTAVFSGAAVGLVYNPAQASNPIYSAAGQFTNTYNFTQRTGNVTISNFDGRTFGGGVAAGTDWRSYSGAVSGSNLSGSVNGSFYGNRTASGQLQMPKNTAGNFNVGGGGYTASGVFVGTR